MGKAETDVAEVLVDQEKLAVRLSFLEKLAAFRGDLCLPVACIQDVVLEPQPWRALRGFRAPGTGLPRVLAYGVRLATGGPPDFAALHGRGPAVRIELTPGGPFGRLLVTVPDPGFTVNAARAVLRPAPAAGSSASPSS